MVSAPRVKPVQVTPHVVAAARSNTKSNPPVAKTIVTRVVPEPLVKVHPDAGQYPPNVPLPSGVPEATVTVSEADLVACGCGCDGTPCATDAVTVMSPGVLGAWTMTSNLSTSLPIMPAARVQVADVPLGAVHAQVLGPEVWLRLWMVAPVLVFTVNTRPLLLWAGPLLVSVTTYRARLPTETVSVVRTMSTLIVVLPPACAAGAKPAIVSGTTNPASSNRRLARDRRPRALLTFPIMCPSPGSAVLQGTRMSLLPGPSIGEGGCWSVKKRLH